MNQNHRVATSYHTSSAVRGLNFGKRVKRNYANLNDQFNLKLEAKT